MNVRVPVRPREPSALTALRFARDPLDMPVRYHSRYGDVFQFRALGESMFLVQDDEFVHDVLVGSHHRFRKDRFTRGLSRLLGQGLLTSEAALWKQQHRLIQPTFQRRSVERSAHDVATVVDDFCDGWERRPHGDIALDTEMCTLMLRIALKVLFGDDARELDGIDGAMKAVFAYFLGVAKTTLNLPMWMPTQANRGYRQACTVLDAFLARVLDRRRAHPGDDLLGKLLAQRDERGEPMSPRQLRDECMTLLIAGHETSAQTLTFSFLLLARHPEHLKTIHDELDSRIADRPVDAGAVRDLPRALAVVKEALRLYPPSWAIGREALQDGFSGGFFVPRGAQVIISQWALHRNARHFERADEFVPGRWTPEFERTLPRYAYLPFGAGPRVCVGMHLAMLEIVIALATLLRRFDVEVAGASGPMPPLVPSITIRPRDPVRARFTSRARTS